MIFKCREREYKEIAYFDMVRWIGSNIKEVTRFVTDAPLTKIDSKTLTIIQPNVEQKVNIGDCIVRGKDEFFVYTQEEFMEKYEIV